MKVRNKINMKLRLGPKQNLKQNLRTDLSEQSQTVAAETVVTKITKH